RGRGHVGGVVAHQAEVVLLDLDVAKLGGTDRAVLDRNLVLLAGPVVGDGQGLFRRRCAGAVLLLRLCRHGAPLARLPGSRGRGRGRGTALEFSTRIALARRWAVGWGAGRSVRRLRGTP